MQQQDIIFASLRENYQRRVENSEDVVDKMLGYAMLYRSFSGGKETEDEVLAKHE